jgi:rhodanese-related sulfurtransferase
MAPDPANTSSPATSASPALTAEELRSLLEQGAAWTILDVRTSEERAEWFISGSVHVDAYEALKAGDSSPLVGLDLPRYAPVVTVCAKGRTSAIAARILRERGFDAYSLAGGMKAWSLAWNTAELTSSAGTLIQLRRTGKG